MMEWLKRAFGLIAQGDADAALPDYCWMCNQVGHALIGFWAVLAVAEFMPAAYAAALVALAWIGWEAWQRLSGRDREGFRNVDMASDLAFEISGAVAGMAYANGVYVLFMVLSAGVVLAAICGVALRNSRPRS